MASGWRCAACVLFHHLAGKAFMRAGLAQTVKPVGGNFAGAALIDDRVRIIALIRRGPWRMDKMGRQMGDFGHPFS